MTTQTMLFWVIFSVLLGVASSIIWLDRPKEPHLEIFQNPEAICYSVSTKQGVSCFPKWRPQQ